MSQHILETTPQVLRAVFSDSWSSAIFFVESQNDILEIGAGEFAYRNIAYERRE